MRAQERGATAVIVAIILILLCGFVALSIDIGHLMSVKGELQNGADAAALAGAKRLNGTNDNFELAGARADALQYARSHPTDQYDVEPSIVELGAWIAAGASCPPGGVPSGPPSPDGHQFCAIDGTTNADAANIYAVRVVTVRAGTPGGDAGGGAVPLAFGSFAGHGGPQEVGAEAIALTGGPAIEDCPELPFAIKKSCVSNGGVVDCESPSPILFSVGFAASGIDSAGMTVFQEAACGDSTGAKINGSSGWGSGDVCDVLEDNCSYHAAVGQCISIKNGENVNANCPDLGMKICDAIKQKFGKVAQVPLVQYSDTESCEGGFSDFNYTHAAKISNIASVRVVGAQCGKHDTPAVEPGYESILAQCALSGFASGNCFLLEFVCDQRDDDQTTVGGGWAGTSPYQPVLVR